MRELTKSFRCEAAHALPGTPLGDLGILERSMAEVQKMLDRRILNKVEALGPPTLEDLSRFIRARIEQAGPVARVSVDRDSCNESCSYYGPKG